MSDTLVSNAVKEMEALVSDKWYSFEYDGKTYPLTNTKIRLFLRAVSQVGGFERIQTMETSGDPLQAFQIIPELVYHIATQNEEFSKDFPSINDFIDGVEFDSFDNLVRVFWWAFAPLNSFGQEDEKPQAENFQGRSKKPK